MPRISGKWSKAKLPVQVNIVSKWLGWLYGWPCYIAFYGLKG